MFELIEAKPYLFPIFFVCLWTFISLLLSLLGGWKKLSSIYAARDSFIGNKWYFQSIKMGLVSYGSCVNIGANSKEFFLFRIGHAPLKIPYSKIRGKEHKGLVFRYVDLYATGAEGTKIRLFKKQADRIENVANKAWQYERL